MRRSVCIVVLVGLAASARADKIGEILGGHDRGSRPWPKLRAALEKAGELPSLRTLTWHPYDLRDRWVGEHRRGFVSKGSERRPIAYLKTPSARARYLVTIGARGLLHAHDERVTFAPNSLLVAGPDGDLYARDSEEIRREAAANPDDPVFAHSTFFGGEPVPMSVEVAAKKGRVLNLENRSGHYRPGRLTFVAWLVQLEEQGLDLSDASISFDPKSVVRDRR